MEVLCDESRAPERDFPFLYFGVEIEKSIEAGLELLLDLLFAAFEYVHGDVRLASIFQLQGCIGHFGDFFRGQKPQPVNQRQVSHAAIVMGWAGQAQTLLTPLPTAVTIPLCSGKFLLSLLWRRERRCVQRRKPVRRRSHKSKSTC